MRKLRGLGLGATMCVVALGVIGCAGADGDRAPATSERALESYTSHLNKALPRLMERYDVPGVAIAVIRGGRPVWSKGYGYANLEKGRPMRVDTVVRAESISKSVTAWGVMHLVEAGVIAPDASVTTIVPDGLFQDSEYDVSETTVAMLLSNSSGLPLGTIGPATEYAPGSPMRSVAEFVTDDARLVQDPGSGFIYSDVGFNLLELVVQEASAEAFAVYMKDHVLTPLGMDNSSYDWQPSFADTIATGYELDGTPVPAYVYPAAASGGLFSDVEELARFVAAGIDTSGSAGYDVLSKESVDTLHTPVVDIPGLFGFVADSYGYGHFVETLPDGRRAVWHGGQGHGWMTHFHAVPETGDGIVVVTNSQRSWPLMAEVLADWSGWTGLGSVRFSRILQAGTVVRYLIALMIGATAIQFFRLIVGVRTGRRGWRVFAKGSGAVRTLQAVSGVGIAAFVVWRVSEPYVFESSIFPTLVIPAAVILAALSAVLLASAACPVVPPGKPRRGERSSPESSGGTQGAAE